MIRSLNDRRRCPHCARDLNDRPYVMARRAGENVLDWTTIAWIITLAVALLIAAGF